MVPCRAACPILMVAKRKSKKQKAKTMCDFPFQKKKNLPHFQLIITISKVKFIFYFFGMLVP
jgi:hypothetical protein